MRLKSLHSLLNCAPTRWLFPLSVASFVYLYLYPIFKGCAFPLAHGQSPQESSSPLIGKLQQNAFASTVLQHLGVPNFAPDNPPAIFRLLVLADPQLEGDTSLPLPEWRLVPRIRKHWRTVRETSDFSQFPYPLSLLNRELLAGVRTIAIEDIPRSLRAVQKQIDLLGNDWYLAHIYRTLFWWTRPTHTTVLGDLLGSQWIDDGEFSSRSWRYWRRVFRGGMPVDDHITRMGEIGSTGKANRDPELQQPIEPLGSDADPSWPRRVINVVGNHDIGYAGDASEARMERFEREFGRANWDIRFQHPPVLLSNATSSDKRVEPTLHLINLNSLTLDTPALSHDVQEHTYAYLNDLIGRLHPVEDRSTFTLLLTHLPLHKEEGICTDEPYFSFHDEDDNDGPDGVPRFKAGGLKEQNHLSDFVSANGILQGIFGMSGDQNATAGGHGRVGLILTGHDHTGCDVVHYVSQHQNENQNQEENSWQWAARRYNGSNIKEEGTPSVREVTLRSMMGEFGGNAGLLSIWFDVKLGGWDYAITKCPAGVQHIWWAVHVIILVHLNVEFARFAIWLGLRIQEKRLSKATLVNKVPNDARGPISRAKEQ
ncbi:hypothetical protein PENDEC_c002G06893 [Penicillium decumbens]|uniref:Calcineurin-like phosphoesterase domain-containing protein n=1 Tax=Penicillium decumbens TaxID=69771 RepID=A0A1V6PL87_PENDC|nr:hypothetical protein PENDEC_c002G06893 [Penicillium decumbens]